MKVISPVLKLDNVSKEYTMGEIKVHALKKVSLEIDEGEFLIIYGPSGSGKSTLLHMLGLLDSPTTGKVFINLRPYTFEVIGVESEHDLMKASGATYGEMHEGWSGEDVKGFTRILGNPDRLYHSMHPFTS